LTLPSLDLPISRTGLLLYYPPTFRVTAETGTFRLQQYQNPISAVLGPPVAAAVETRGAGGAVGAIISNAPTAPAIGGPLILDKQTDNEKKDAMQSLLDTFKAKSSGGRVTGILPVNVSFPAFGPSIFLVSELTSENQFPAAEFSFQRDKKGGVR